MTSFKSRHNLGDFVYLTTDPDQLQRVIVEVIFSAIGVVYTLACGTEYSRHTALEFATERNLDHSYSMN